VIWLAAAAMLLAVAGNFVFLALDQSRQFEGYDQESYQVLLTRLARPAPVSFTAGVRDWGYQYSLLYLPVMRLGRWCGPARPLLFVMPMLGLALMLWCAWLLAARLGGATAGWLAAAALSLSPFAYGLARKFDAWTLTMGLYLALVYAVMRYAARPTWPRALGVGLLAALGLSAAHDPTSLLLTTVYTAGPIAWAMGVALTARGQPAWKRVTHLALMLAAPFVWYDVFWLGAGLAHGYVGYLSNESRIAGAQVDWLSSLGGYPAACWRELLGPVGAGLFLVGGAAFAWLRRRRVHLVWLILPLGALLALSAIPKKNPWYILDALTLLPVLAAVALAGVLNRLSARKGFILAAVLLGALVTQYVCALFLPLPFGRWLDDYHRRTMQASEDAAPPIFRALTPPTPRANGAAIDPPRSFNPVAPRLVSGLTGLTIQPTKPKSLRAPG
jgi:hypothetical protein